MTTGPTELIAEVRRLGEAAKKFWQSHDPKHVNVISNRDTAYRTLAPEMADALEAALRDIEQITEQSAGLTDTIVQLINEKEAALADNAALLDVFGNLYQYLDETLRPCEPDCGCWADSVEGLLAQPHPGAGLLARLAKLERVVELERTMGGSCNQAGCTNELCLAVNAALDAVEASDAQA